LEEGGIHRHTGTQTAWRSHKPSFIFSNDESKLKTNPLYITNRLIHNAYMKFYAKFMIQ
jgi:hypothetical protein